MHLLTTPLVYRLLTFKSSPQRTKIIGVILTIIFTIVMTTHMLMDEFLLHATTFGLSVLIVTIGLMRTIKQQVPDGLLKVKFRYSARFGLSMYNPGCYKNEQS